MWSSVQKFQNEPTIETEGVNDTPRRQLGASSVATRTAEESAHGAARCAETRRRHCGYRAGGMLVDRSPVARGRESRQTPPPSMQKLHRVLPSTGPSTSSERTPRRRAAGTATAPPKSLDLSHTG